MKKKNNVKNIKSKKVKPVKAVKVKDKISSIKDQERKVKEFENEEDLEYKESRDETVSKQ